MLRIEAYPVMNGLRVCITGTEFHREPDHEGNWPLKAETTIDSETIECLGLTEALRDVIVDALVKSPDIVKRALR